MRSSSSNNTFLSGEAEADTKLGSMLSSIRSLQLQDQCQDDDDKHSTAISLSSVAAPSSRSKIQVIEEINHNEGNEHSSENDDDEDEEPPPFFTSASALALATEARSFTESKGLTATEQKNKNEEIETETEIEMEPSESSLMEEMMKEAKIAQDMKEKKRQDAERRNAKKSSFGLKKGFLNTTNTKKKKKKEQTKAKRSVPTATTFSSSVQNVDQNQIFELDAEGNMMPVPVQSADQEEQPPPIRNLREVETIPKPKSSTHGNKKNNPLQFKEVQEAMNTDAFTKGLHSATSSPDLLQKISNNPKLLAGMSNPKFTAALEALQQNPKQALEKLRGGGHQDVMEFLNEICSVMGDHFLQLDEEQEQQQKKSDEKMKTNTITSSTTNTTSGSTNSTAKDKGNDSIGPLASEALRREKERTAKGEQSLQDNTAMDPNERAKLDAVMQDAELTSWLMDANMQRVIQECSSIPGKMRWYMTHEEYGPKLRRMVQAGLLQIA